MFPESIVFNFRIFYLMMPLSMSAFSSVFVFQRFVKSMFRDLMNVL